MVIKLTDLLGGSVDDAVEGEDGANALGSVIEFTSSTADDGQQNGDDFLNTEGTESGQGHNAIKDFLAGLEFSAEQRQELIDDDGVLAVAEITQNGDGEALGGRETRAT